MIKSYKKKIFNHNIKKVNLMIKMDLNMIFSAKILTQADQNTILQTNSINKIKKIVKVLK